MNSRERSNKRAVTQYATRFSRRSPCPLRGIRRAMFGGRAEAARMEPSARPGKEAFSGLTGVLLPASELCGHLGRFASRDPIGYEAAGVNLVEYALGSPGESI